MTGDSYTGAAINYACIARIERKKLGVLNGHVRTSLQLRVAKKCD